MYAVIIKVFYVVLIVCASLRSAPALGKDNEQTTIDIPISYSFPVLFGLFRENSCCISVSPFLNKKKIQMFRKKRTNNDSQSDRCMYSCFPNYLGMFLEQFGRIVLLFLYSPFFNKNKMNMFRKIQSEVPRGAKRRAHRILLILYEENIIRACMLS